MDAMLLAADDRRREAVAPSRSLAQRMDALGKANVVRIDRARIKRELKAGRADVLLLLVEPPACVETAKVIDLLLCVPKYGRVKVLNVLSACQISPVKTVAGLTGRQSAELVSMWEAMEKRRAVELARRLVGPAPGYARNCLGCGVELLRRVPDGRCEFCRVELGGVRTTDYLSGELDD